MMARKVGNARTGVYIPKQSTTRSVLFDMSPELRGIVSAIKVIVLLFVALALVIAFKTKVGYEVVEVQQKVVQLTKDNDTLDVEVATLKSPVRIQQIAEKDLGMVLPDSFVYSTKGATAERNVQKGQQIVD